MENKRKAELIALIGVVVALIALIPAFGQWLAPDIVNSRRKTTTTPLASPSASTPVLPSTPRPTVTIIPGWEGRQREYEIGDVMRYSIHAGAPASGGSGLKFVIDLNDNEPFSLNQRGTLTEIGDLRVCSSANLISAQCPDPDPTNDTETIPEAWVMTNDVIVWTLPVAVPGGKAVSATIRFVANADVAKDGDFIQMRGKTITPDGESYSPGQLYVLRTPIQ